MKLNRRDMIAGSAATAAMVAGGAKAATMETYYYFVFLNPVRDPHFVAIPLKFDLRRGLFSSLDQDRLKIRKFFFGGVYRAGINLFSSFLGDFLPRLPVEANHLWLEREIDSCRTQSERNLSRTVTYEVSVAAERMHRAGNGHDIAAVALRKI